MSFHNLTLCTCYNFAMNDFRSLLLIKNVIHLMIFALLSPIHQLRSNIIDSFTCFVIECVVNYMLVFGLSEHNLSFAIFFQKVGSNVVECHMYKIYISCET